MSDAAARIVAALETAADAELGAKTALVSVTIDVITHADAARIEARTVRKTRSLIFMAANVFDADGAPIATASSVHKPSA